MASSSSSSSSISTPFSISCPASLQFGGSFNGQAGLKPKTPHFIELSNAGNLYTDSDRPTSESILCIGLKLLLGRNATPWETFHLIAEVCTFTSKFLLNQNFHIERGTHNCCTNPITMSKCQFDAGSLPLQPNTYISNECNVAAAERRTRQ